MFEKYTAEQYRALDADAFESRRAEVEGMLRAETLPEGVTTDELVSESELIISEARSRKASAELRNQTIEELRAGANPAMITASSNPNPTKEDRMQDIFDSVEYRDAFMNFFCRGKQLPEQFRTGDYEVRENAYTATGDVPVMIPTTLSRRIIEELEAESDLYARVDKTNVKGGVKYPILSLRPEAYWVGETEVSDYQKVEAKLTVDFGYYELECRIGQTLLESIVTFDEFQARFIPMAVRAIRRKIEAGIVAGTGEGQMLGIVNDSRITNSATMTAAQVVNWKEWRKKVNAAIPRAYRGGQYIMAQSTWDTYIETLSDDNNAPVSIGYNPVTGNEIRRLMGCEVILVDDELLPGFDSAAANDVFCIYGRLSDYCINTNHQLQSVQFIDWDTRQKKTIAYMVLDGKVLDPNGFVLVKKSA